MMRFGHPADSVSLVARTPVVLYVGTTVVSYEGTSVALYSGSSAVGGKKISVGKVRASGLLPL